jgi:hypothetical protein
MFAESALGITQAYPPGAILPKYISKTGVEGIRSETGPKNRLRFLKS